MKTLKKEKEENGGSKKQSNITNGTQFRLSSGWNKYQELDSW